MFLTNHTMSEFRLHHLVKELLDISGMKERDDTPKDFVEFLQKKMTTDNKTTTNSPILIQSLVQHLAQTSPNPQQFLVKVEDLKEKNVDSLCEYVQLLHYISQDAGLKEFLQKPNKRLDSLDSYTSLSSSSTTVTKDDLQQVKSRLKKAISKQSQNKELERSKIFDKSIMPVASSTSVTSWVQRRPSMSWDFSSAHLTSSSRMLIENIPADSQENMLIEDLLNILIGLAGCYIEALPLRDQYSPREFIISETVEPSLKELVKQILPLASHYSIVQRFTEEKMRFEFGQVCNALAECMGSLIIEYTLFITQLETESRSGNLNLHKMWFYVQKNLHNLSIMSNIATSISKSDAKGGKVLSLLHDHVTGYIGDAKAQKLCLHLMQAACVPYMKMLGMWIYKGIISDPISEDESNCENKNSKSFLFEELQLKNENFNISMKCCSSFVSIKRKNSIEFLVEDNEVVQKEDMPVDYSADYWEKKYTIRRERIPKFLEPVSDMILRAGKYLNVIRQCGKPVNNKVQLIEYKIEQKHYIDAIENAYKFASQTLLDLILKEKDLLGRLRSVKHYFLLDQGDFIVTFLTLCEKELNKDVVDVVQGRLESLLDLALRLSSSNNDPYKDDLRTELLPYDLQYQMLKILTVLSLEERDYMLVKLGKKSNLTVIESFAFSYEVRWPLSLILNRRSLACYQMIFRHLFYCKHVERMMCQVWRSNKVAKAFPFPAASQYRTAFALRQRMLHCIQNLEYHMMVEVIEPHWCLFMQKISKVSNIDEVLTCHCDFLDSCLKDCMLTIPDLLTTITHILAICVKFCKFMQGESIFQTGNTSEPLEQTESFKESVTNIDKEFSEALKELLDQINGLNKETSDHERLYNLLYRLDFNSFYTGQFEKLGLKKMEISASG